MRNLHRYETQLRDFEKQCEVLREALNDANHADGVLKAEKQVEQLKKEMEQVKVCFAENEQQRQKEKKKEIVALQEKHERETNLLKAALQTYMWKRYSQTTTSQSTSPGTTHQTQQTQREGEEETQTLRRMLEIESAARKEAQEKLYHLQSLVHEKKESHGRLEVEELQKEIQEMQEERGMCLLTKGFRKHREFPSHVPSRLNSMPILHHSAFGQMGLILRSS